MEFPARDWMDLFAWLRQAAEGRRLARCQRSFFPSTLSAEAAEVLRQDVNHWLATDSWPPQDPLEEAWSSVFLHFALHELMDGMRLGLPLPATELQAKGVVQRILQRDRWPEVAIPWLDLFLDIQRKKQVREN